MTPTSIRHSRSRRFDERRVLQLAADQADQNAWSLASNTISSWHMVVNSMSGILTLAFDTFKAVGAVHPQAVSEPFGFDTLPVQPC